MESVLKALLEGGSALSVELVLVLLIFGFVTKRIVPWWVYEEVDGLNKAITSKVESVDEFSPEEEYMRGYMDALEDIRAGRLVRPQTVGGVREDGGNHRPRYDGPPSGRYRDE